MEKLHSNKYLKFCFYLNLFFRHYCFYLNFNSYKKQFTCSSMLTEGCSQHSLIENCFECQKILCIFFIIPHIALSLSRLLFFVIFTHQNRSNAPAVVRHVYRQCGVLRPDLGLAHAATVLSPSHDQCCPPVSKSRIQIN